MLYPRRSIGAKAKDLTVKSIRKSRLGYELTKGKCAWFWGTLVDADPANNAASWQWIAGSGADAAPYFRVFNPVLQGERFDPDGFYVRRWLPELADLPSSVIHRPWQLSRNADVYPEKIIEHDRARQRALDALKTLS